MSYLVIRKFNLKEYLQGKKSWLECNRRQNPSKFFGRSRFKYLLDAFQKILIRYRYNTFFWKMYLDTIQYRYTKMYLETVSCIYQILFWHHWLNPEKVYWFYFFQEKDTVCVINNQWLFPVHSRVFNKEEEECNISSDETGLPFEIADFANSECCTRGGRFGQ